MPTAISLVVCTYNRAGLLAECLRSAGEQTLDPSQYEVIVVDNGSTDRTREIVEELARGSAHLHYYFEEELGLGYARNRGLELAQGAYVGYIDDDARVCPDYLETALRLFVSLQPSPHCLGGPIKPWYTTTKPPWFKDEYESRRMWDSPRHLQKYGSFSGSNQIWETETLRKLGGFNVDVGVKGNMMGMGEETAVFYRAWDVLENPRFYYSPSLVVYHWVPPHKMSLTYQLKRRFAEGQSMPGLCCNSFRTKCGYFVSRPYWLARALLRAGLNLQVHPDVRNWLVEDWGRVSRLTGEMVGCITTRPFFRQR